MLKPKLNTPGFSRELSSRRFRRSFREEFGGVGRLRIRGQRVSDVHLEDVFGDGRPAEGGPGVQTALARPAGEVGGEVAARPAGDGGRPHQVAAGVQGGHGGRPGGVFARLADQVRLRRAHLAFHDPRLLLRIVLRFRELLQSRT